MSSHAPNPSESGAEGYERGEPPPRWIVVFLIGLFLFVTISGLGVQAFFLQVVQHETHTKLGEIPNVEWNTLKADADKQLGSYGWVDDKTVHIPLSRALELTVQDLNKKPEPAKAEPAKK